MHKEEPPIDREPSDILHVIVRAGLSTIPVFGGPAVELFNILITPPLEKRRDEWMKMVAEALRDLENSRFDLQRLQSDQRFITIVLQATAIAIRNHQHEKLIVLRNAIINSAKRPNLNEDIQLIFIRYIDELTPTHIKLLSFLIRDVKDIETIKSHPQLYELFTTKHPDSMPRDEFKMLFQDLSARGLVRVSSDIYDFEDIYHADTLLLHSANDELPRVIITEVARQFLDFITSDTRSAV